MEPFASNAYYLLLTFQGLTIQYEGNAQELM